MSENTLPPEVETMRGALPNMDLAELRNEPPQAMREIGHLIATQDNRCTSDPLFIVQQKKRIYGMDGNYCEDYEWLQEDDHEHVADRIERAGLDALADEGEDVTGWEKLYYLDTWEFVTVCFTEKACKDYIAANGHNLNEPRIYASSAYRNHEMIAIRDYLKTIGT